MITIPSAMKTLLKSKIQAGANRPSARVKVSGQPVSGDVTAWSAVQDIRSGSSKVWTGGSFATRADGTILVTYGDMTNKAVYLSTVDTEADLFGASNESITNEWLFYTLVDGVTSTAPSRLLRLDDGSILLFIIEGGVWVSQGNNIEPRILVYKSANGMGDDFALLNTIVTGGDADAVGAYFDWGQEGTGIGQPCVLPSGRILIPFSAVANSGFGSGQFGTCGAHVVYSDDGFVTYTSQCIIANWIYRITIGGNRGISYWPNSGGMLLGLYQSTDYSAAAKGVISYDEGATWSSLEGFGGLGASVGYNMFYASNGINYYVRQNTLLGGWHILRRDSEGADLDISELNYLGIDGWVEVQDQLQWTSDVLMVWRTDAGYLAIAGTSGSDSIIYGDELIDYELPVKLIEISMSKGSAAQASVVIDNKSGVYSPDQLAGNDWKDVITPNKTLTIDMGYGRALPTVCTALIDTVRMGNSSSGAEMEISGRDYLKKALDQLVRAYYVDHYAYTVLYQSQTVEYIFRDLAIKAGWLTGDVHTGVSGITLTEITFTHESYADAFQRLAELSGFEWFVDETGDLYFYYATDRKPEATDEAVVLNGTTNVALAEYPVVTASILVYSAAGKTGTKYTADVDYTITAGDEDTAWNIKRIAGGAIGDGATVYVNYVYAAWVFREGQDITMLDYLIDDTEVQDSVIVIGQDSDGVYIRGDYDPAYQYYNVLPGKVQIVNAGDLASTNAQCTEIATRVFASGLIKARVATFEICPGNPYIQVGDCIQVIESTSKISEIYRIFEMSHRWDATNGSRTNVTTYHYGYAPATGVV